MLEKLAAAVTLLSRYVAQSVLLKLVVGAGVASASAVLDEVGGAGAVKACGMLMTTDVPVTLTPVKTPWQVTFRTTPAHAGAH